MCQVDYFALTQLIIDDVYLPDGTKRLDQLGGGVYPVAGLRIFAPHTGFCFCEGMDFQSKFEGWFLDNNIDLARVPRQALSTHVRINYFPDGEREEVLLPGVGEHRLMLPEINEIPERYGQCKGLYFYKDCEADYWQNAIDYFSRHQTIVVWELGRRSTFPEYYHDISRYLNYVELFSVNLSEGMRICRLDKPVDIVRHFHSMGARVLLLRMGAQGSLVSDGKSVWHIPAVATSVIDVTGGGNASTGGFLAGWCESEGDIRYAGLCSSVAASFIINQYGVPNLINDDLMREALERISSLEPSLICSL